MSVPTAFYIPSSSSSSSSTDITALQTQVSALKTDVNGATAVNSNSTLVKRDATGSFAASTVKLDAIESNGATLDIAGLNGTSTVNVGKGTGVQTINMGNSGTGATTLNLGGSGDTVNVGSLAAPAGAMTLYPSGLALNSRIVNGGSAFPADLTMNMVAADGTYNSGFVANSGRILLSGKCHNSAYGVKPSTSGIQSQVMQTNQNPVQSKLVFLTSSSGTSTTIAESASIHNNGLFFCTSVSAPGTVTTGAIESSGTTLTIAGQNNTSVVDIGKGTGVQTINLGNNGTGKTTIKLGGGTDEVLVNLPLKDSAGSNILNVTTAGMNTFVGLDTASVSTGSHNTCIGRYSGRGLTSGNDNVTVGVNTGYSAGILTTGSMNTLIGNLARVTDGTQVNSTAIGYQAQADASNCIQLGNSVVTAVKTSGTLYAAGLESFGATPTILNIASANNTNTVNIGSGAGVQAINVGNNGTGKTTITLGGGTDEVKVNLPLKDSTGANIIDIPSTNCMIGKNVFNNLAATSTSCTAVGVNIGGSNVADNVSNTFFGRDIAQSLTGEYAYCTAVGHGALKNVNGWSNTAFGYNSFSELTTGGNNVGFGIRTGSAHTAVTTGINNTFIGATAGSDNANRNNGTAVGYNARVDFDNCVQLGNTLVTQVRTSGTITAAGLKLPTTGGTAATLDCYEEFSFVTKFNTTPNTADITFSMVRVGTVVTCRMKGDLSFIPPDASFLLQNVTAIPARFMPNQTTVFTLFMKTDGSNSSGIVTISPTNPATMTFAPTAGAATTFTYLSAYVISPFSVTWTTV